MIYIKRPRQLNIADKLAITGHIAVALATLCFSFCALLRKTEADCNIPGYPFELNLETEDSGFD